MLSGTKCKKITVLNRTTTYIVLKAQEPLHYKTERRNPIEFLLSLLVILKCNTPVYDWRHLGAFLSRARYGLDQCLIKSGLLLRRRLIE